jgi:malonate transporter MadL subunit
MVIYGVALLAVCTIAGLYLGDLLGMAIGVEANVGGVGFAMVLLMFGSAWLIRHGELSASTSQGIAFWNAIYIPIVVAMAAQQNVVGALSGGAAAILAGLLAVIVCGALVPAVNRLRRQEPAVPARAEPTA